MADLTTLNANVLYELGLAHGLQVPTVLLAQSIDEVPFDLRSYRIIPYSTQFDQVNKLRTALGEIAGAHRAGTITFGSPIIDFYAIERAAPAASAPDEEVETVAPERSGDEVFDDEPPGFLEAQVEALDAAEGITSFFEAFNAETAQVTAELEARAPAVQEAANAEDPGAARRMLALAHELSRAMQQYGEHLEALLPSFEAQVETFTDRSELVIQSATIGSVEDLRGAEEARATSAGLLDVTSENLRSTRESRTLANDFGAGASREMSRAGQRVARLLDRYIAGLERLEAFSARAVFIWDAKIDEWTQGEGAT